MRTPLVLTLTVLVCLVVAGAAAASVLPPGAYTVTNSKGRDRGFDLGFGLRQDYNSCKPAKNPDGSAVQRPGPVTPMRYSSAAMQCPADYRENYAFMVVHVGKSAMSKSDRLTVPLYRFEYRIAQPNADGWLCEYDVAAYRRGTGWALPPAPVMDPSTQRTSAPPVTTLTFSFKKAGAGRVRAALTIPPIFLNPWKDVLCDDGTKLTLMPSIIPKQTWYSATFKASMLRSKLIAITFPHVAKTENLVHAGWLSLTHR